MIKKTVEETYQKKTQLEHILLRPDTYIGSVEQETQNMYVWDESSKKIVLKNIKYVPGLYKIFDEIIVNAADNKIRDPSMTTIKVEINKEENLISVMNDGQGIPIKIHKTENVYVPELIFGQLLTSSNYDDNEKKVTGGRNGYGAKLCNIFSTEFIVETADLKEQKYYKQIYINNMSVTGKPQIKKYTKNEFTKISFRPDLKRFNMECLDDDTISLLTKRIYDLSGVVKNVKVYLNDVKIGVKNFKEYINLYLQDETTVVHQIINDRWEVGFTTGEDQLQQVSFVNSICTSKGGTHVNHVLDQLIEILADHLKKKHKVTNIRPIHIKSNMFLFINCLIENPTFDSQTKENMTLRQNQFGKKCESIKDFSEKIIKNTNLIENILALLKSKESAKLKKTDGSKKKNITVPKLEDASLAGTPKSNSCILFLTEGDSAKTLVMAGRSCIGADICGVFPLRGKFLNVREASLSQISENKEIVNLKRILGLQHNKEYTDTTSLRYGHVMIMTDQDHDGSHIKGLLINFFDYFYPSLLKLPNFLQSFITPIVRARNKRGEKIDFFSMVEAKEFMAVHSEYEYKYYKGLGTSTTEDANDYFSNLPKHVKNFSPLRTEDRELIDLAFNKKKSDQRKNWILEYEAGTCLDNSRKNILISDFVNKELILFSIADNIRSIPSMIDGFKPGQRKIIFTCLKKNIVNEVKVNQLAGTIGAISAYHHGEVSLQTSIVSLAHDFVGSNNINLLLPIGQFGSRLQGGKDFAAPRYINTKLNKLTRYIFHRSDDMILNYLEEENVSIEPSFYMPIIPMVLVNGADGIGTGWSTNIPNYNPKDIIKNIKKLLDDEPQEEMVPYYRNFIGTIEKIEPFKYRVDGVWEVDEDIYITELPIGLWTGQYKEYLDKLIANGDIEGYSDRNTDKTIDIKIVPKNKNLNYKLSLTICTSNMICFDRNCKIKKFDTPEEIIKEFYYLRLQYYLKRKEKLLEVLGENVIKYENKVRFIKAVVSDELIISKRKRKDIVEELKKTGYVEFDNYGYLLSMEILSLTEEKIEILTKELEKSREEYKNLLNRTPKSLWREDLDTFEEVYDKEMELETKVYDKARGNATVNNKKEKQKTRKASTQVKTITETITDVKKGKKIVKKNTKIEKVTTRKRTKIDPVIKLTKKKVNTRNASFVVEEESTSSNAENVWAKY